MAQIQNQIASTEVQPLANYDWTDLVSGLGYRNFYLTWLGARSLTPQSIESGHTDYNEFTSETGVTLTSPFNSPMIVKGDAYASFTISKTGNSTGNISITIKLQKYDGSDYTDISTSGTITGSIGTGYSKTQGATKLTITETRIKKGEYLVLNITTLGAFSYVISNSSTYLSYIAIPFNIKG